jgi:rod shape-determining protein MreC
MESFFVRYRNPLLLVALVLVQVIMLASQIARPVPGSTGQPLDHPDAHSVRLIRLWTEGAAAPFERAFYWVGHGVRSVWGNYFALRGAKKQNDELKAEVERLRLEQASLAEDARQGHRLQAMLNFKQKYMGTLVPAQIIGTSGSDQSRVLYIDKGKADGIKPGMPVITPDGIVGKVRDVLANTSQVLLINDQTSGAGVLLQTTRIRGVVRGNGYGQLEIVNVMPDDRIQPGETVLASGGDQIFPRGMPVGTVEKVQHDPAHDPYIQVIVQPAANLSRLEEVLVVTSQASAPPAALAQDVASSEDLAAQQRKAAEVLAEKLPTVKPEELQANEMATGPDRPHQPPQPLHPDRFSVGATPPAAEMQPGARPATVASSAQSAAPPATQTAKAAAKPVNPDDTAPVAPQPKPKAKTAPAAAADDANAEEAKAAKTADKAAKASKDSTINPEDFGPIKSPADGPAEKP